MIRSMALALLVAGCAAHPEAAPPPTVAGVELRCAAGEGRVALGGVVQVIELWATWCQPCIQSLPLWSKLAREEGVEVLAVAIDDEAEAPIRFAKKNGVDLPILWDPFANEIARAVPLTGVVPTTLVIDCEGRVRHVHEGYRGPESIEEIASQVRALQRESACAARPPLRECAP